jgi:hypothetical protein
VDHAALVGERDGVAHALDQAEHLRRAPLGIALGAPTVDLRERAAADELHREEGAALGVEPELVDGDDPGVVELARDPRLVQEARDLSGEDRGSPGGRARLRLVEDHLHRQRAVEPAIADAKDGSHAAAPQLAFDGVATVGAGILGDRGEQPVGLGALRDLRGARGAERAFDVRQGAEDLAQLAFDLRMRGDQGLELGRSGRDLPGEEVLEQALRGPVPQIAGVALAHARTIRTKIGGSFRRRGVESSRSHRRPPGEGLRPRRGACLSAAAGGARRRGA